MEKKTCYPIILPTNENSNEELKSDRDYLSLVDDRIFNPFKNKYYNIFILSDEEIKNGDWFIDLYNLDTSKYCDSTELAKKLNFKKEQVKKIIATDGGLAKTIKSTYIQFGLKVEETKIQFLPQPSKDFIQKYIKSYNTRKPMTEVMVDYCWCGHPDDFDNPHGFGVRVNEANEIFISEIKNIWIREEVIDILKKYDMDIHNHPNLRKSVMCDCVLPINVDNWVSQNL